MNQEEYEKIISRITKNVNETIRLKRDYHNTLIGVDGVCFGVLVAMKDSGTTQLSNWLYFVGLICCALSLIFLVIGARGAIAAHKNRREELVGELLGYSLKKQSKKSIKGYKICRIIGYFLFFASIILFCIYSYFAVVYK